MSVTEDTELRDLVTRLLEGSGLLNKLRAELRANVFLALEKPHLQEVDCLPQVNPGVKAFLKKPGSVLVFSLVRELLAYLGLENTEAVFNVETYEGKDYQYMIRSEIRQALRIEKFEDLSVPLLANIVHIVQETQGSSITPAPKNEELQAGDSAANIHSPKPPVLSNISYSEISNASADNSSTVLNQTFTTGALVTSFGSHDAGSEKRLSTELETNQPKSQATDEKKPQRIGSTDSLNSKDSQGGGQSRQESQSGDGKSVSPKDKPSTNPLTSLSNLPPIIDLKTDHGAAAKSYIESWITDDRYEEDLSSESSGVGDKDSRRKYEKSLGKKGADSPPDKTSSKDINSPIASVSEELEGDTNSVTEDMNSAASADTIDTSLSYVETKIADHIEEV